MQRVKVSTGGGDSRYVSVFHRSPERAWSLLEGPRVFGGLAGTSSLGHTDPWSGGSIASPCPERRLVESSPGSRLLTFKASLCLVFTRKIRFTGKGYRIKKSPSGKSTKMTFGHSHRVHTLCASCRVLRLAKQKFIFFSNRPGDLLRDALLVRRVRKPSPYTKRGLRLSRDSMLKRPGKKSSY